MAQLQANRRHCRVRRAPRRLRHSHRARQQVRRLPPPPQLARHARQAAQSRGDGATRRRENLLSDLNDETQSNATGGGGRRQRARSRPCAQAIEETADVFGKES